MGLTLRDRFINDFKSFDNNKVFNNVYFLDAFDDLKHVYLVIKDHEEYLDSFQFPLFTSEIFYLNENMNLIINHYNELNNERITEKYNNYLYKNIESWKFKCKLENEVKENNSKTKKVKI